ncbi:MAG: DUF1846 family protein [candidate division WS1 bacterium]|jgi:uncharacterized protein (UPF0371 family)|nr:DUF1846 family protein [candidate division WS1 bacterium]
MTTAGFDNDRYLAEQKAAILERVEQCRGKLYLEFGGKLTFDFHAARVLPGYDPNVKMRLLQDLRDDIEVVFCVYADDLESGRIRGDFGVTYDLATLRAIDDLRDWGIATSALVITRYRPGTISDRIAQQMEAKGIDVYRHLEIAGYPNDVELAVSDEGYGRNDYIATEAPIVIVTGTGPGSGKMSTCLSQLYHDQRNGLASGYAKFETFPIWDLPVDHPVNVAYEAATADLGDIVMLDSFHLEAYGQTAVNYNRDIENFPILKAILDRIAAEGGERAPYQSPTDMGVNRAGAGIVDDDLVREASRQEVIRRYFRYRRERVQGMCSPQAVQRTERLMARLGVTQTDRPVVTPAREAAADAERRCKGNEGFYCGAALELHDGTIMTGSNSPLLHSASAAIIKGIKRLAGIPEHIHLLPAHVIGDLADLKANYLDSNSPSLNVQEVLIALGITAASNPAARAGIEMLPQLRGAQMHLTHEPGMGDEVGLRKLGIGMTTDAAPTTNGYFLR